MNTVIQIILCIDAQGTSSINVCQVKDNEGSMVKERQAKTTKGMFLELHMT